MTEDELIARLRAGVLLLNHDSPGQQPIYSVVTANQTMRKAADTITRLLAERDAALLAGVRAGIEAAAKVADSYVEGVKPAAGWTGEFKDGFEVGVADCSVAITAYIRQVLDPLTIAADAIERGDYRKDAQP